ncbi:MAG: diadenylate cyclase [Verrucomicrobiales bacterium]
MFDILKQFETTTWQPVIEIIVISIFVFWAYRRFRAKRGVRVLALLLVGLLLITLISQLLDLKVINLLVKSLSFFLSIGLIVAFQPELRRAIAELGNSGFLFISEKKLELAEQLEGVVKQLAAKRFGAIFAIERGIELNSHLETGVEIDAKFTPELVMTIFHSKTALHDGGMIIREGRILGAGCVFPVTQKEFQDRSIGLRHRAGVGLTEESDAIAIVVSEETGDVSICHSGQIERDLDAETFRRRLRELLEVEEEKPSTTSVGEDGSITGNPSHTTNPIED